MKVITGMVNVTIKSIGIHYTSVVATATENLNHVVMIYSFVQTKAANQVPVLAVRLFF